MNRQDLVCGVLSLMLEDIELLKKKNLDYSPGDDALANFRDFGVPGIITRIGDKYHRAKTWAKRGSLAVKTEQIVDTVMDICVYGYIARVMLDESGEFDEGEKGVENAGTEEYNYAEISHGRPERS